MKTKKPTQVGNRRKTGGDATPSTPQTDESVKAAAARMAQAEAEDEADAAWMRETAKIEARVRLEHPNLAWYEVTRIAHKEFPPQPDGFGERRVHCNRCGQTIELHPQYDATFCRRCNRWIEVKCQNPNCEFCGKRPEKPLPVAKSSVRRQRTQSHHQPGTD